MGFEYSLSPQEELYRPTNGNDITLSNSLAANLSSDSTPWGVKNLTGGLDFDPLQIPKCINGLTFGKANCKT
nr:hypothetical protein [Tanacetum cinerariifolium]